MTYYIKGDITNSRCDVICHQVNCRGKMGSGVAKAIKEKWLDVYVNYLYWCDREEHKEDLLGKIQAIELEGEPTQYIVNMFTQNYYGHDGARYTSYDAFITALETLRDQLKGHPDKTIAFPYKIGCVRGGADWIIIQHMIEETLEDRDIYYYYLDESILEPHDEILVEYQNKAFQ